MMKKVVTFFLLISAITGMCLAVASCGGGKTTPKPGVIDGIVKWLDVNNAGAGSTGLPNIIITAWDANDQKVASILSSSDGKFTIPNVPTGTYTVTGCAPADAVDSVQKRWLVTGVKVLPDQLAAVTMAYQDAIGDKLPAKYLTSN
jgi:hypothetical protein